MTADYTLAAVAAPLAVVTLEATVLRTGIFRTRRYWGTLALVLAFQIVVDGLLTAGANPVVAYRADATSGLRFPWNIPIEDFGFGFALVTLTIALWVRHGAHPHAPAAPGAARRREPAGRD